MLSSWHIWTTFGYFMCFFSFSFQSFIRLFASPHSQLLFGSFFFFHFYRFFIQFFFVGITWYRETESSLRNMDEETTKWNENIRNKTSSNIRTGVFTHSFFFSFTHTFPKIQPTRANHHISRFLTIINLCLPLKTNTNISSRRKVFCRVRESWISIEQDTRKSRKKKSEQIFFYFLVHFAKEKILLWWYRSIQIEMIHYLCGKMISRFMSKICWIRTRNVYERGKKRKSRMKKFKNYKHCKRLKKKKVATYIPFGSLWASYPMNLFDAYGCLCVNQWVYERWKCFEELDAPKCIGNTNNISL